MNKSPGFTSKEYETKITDSPRWFRGEAASAKIDCIYENVYTSRVLQMIVESFDWDAGNVGHIARHRVSTDEVEEVFESRYYLTRGRDGRYEALGISAAGRYLFCVLEKTSVVGRIRIVTARDMMLRERKHFKRKI